MHFDKKLIKLLTTIKRNDGIKHCKLLEKFDDDFLTLLIPLIQEGYILAKNKDGKYYFYSQEPYFTDIEYTYYTTTKGNELVEKKAFDFWKWIIPTIISIISLVISTITLLLSFYGNDIIKVILIK